MFNLTIINRNGINVACSTEVAAITETRHDNLLAKIKNYIDILHSSNLRSMNFFIESTYINGKNTEQPCYLLTRKGCDLVANKITGEKGVLFSAAYVTRFDEMEQSIKSSVNTTELSPELQMFNSIFQALASNELAQKKFQMEINVTEEEVTSAKEEVAIAKQEVEGMRQVICLNPSRWRSDLNNIIAKIAIQQGGSSEAYKRVRDESYELLDARGGAKLSIRLSNRRRKVLEETGSKSKSEKVSKLDCIAEDKRLTEVYLAIVKEMAIKYRVV
jgi:Rha family phage regulatory protein